VLTFRCARAALAACAAARIGAAITLSVMTLSVMTSSSMTWNSARADGIVVGGCVGARGALNCVARWGLAGDPNVRRVPQANSETEKARAAERDHKWLSRCRPVIQQDAYGVPRYHYAAVGCEFGVIE
jgi:hypothetical protein